MFRDAAKYYNSDTNYNRYFNDKKFVNLLLNTITKKLKRPLSKNESSYIINHLQNVNPILFKNSPEKIFEVLVTDIIAKITSQPMSPDEYDIHEILKDQIGLASNDANSSPASNTEVTSQITQQFANSVSINNILGTSSLNDIKNLFANKLDNNISGIIMDTRYRNLNTDGKTSLSWGYQNNASTAQGTTNSLFTIQNITAMRIKEIRMPYVASADNQYKRITMYIQDFASQAIVAQENVLYHFMFHTEIDGRWINLKLPRDVDGIFRFKNPLANINNLNISFGSPLQSVIFDVDRMNLQVTGYGTTIQLTSVNPHNLQTGDLIYISNFTTANPSYDINVISQVNFVNGLLAIYIDQNNISLQVDASSLLFVGVGTIATTNASPVITGTSTTFNTTFNIGDFIQIATILYKIISITSDTVLNISVPYTSTNTGLAYSKNNTISQSVSTYFGSKRMFIEMEFEYL